MFDKLLKVHEELEELNNQIIAEQKDVIAKLQQQNQLLIEIIEKYLLNGKKFNEFNKEPEL
jgi:uncharacterized coiled-coil protein SlyX